MIYDERNKLRTAKRQKMFVRESIRRALKELHEARLSRKELPNARHIFRHMDGSVNVTNGEL